ncbi:endonuclease/exonuclease/phosphatase family protein [Zobellia roscoffensis]|uniref:endonuclease/exonuclease/phosphatase family protein n=1 Tax=Zobellia roscoffensis TaxID=2779508 RepID=UPI00188C1C38|nr:endonuclease/exonuclease/phosphatase family protein [Zobellia roscoffensis]
MKIVTWNCNGALRNKFEALFVFDADIYVVQECENPLKTNHKKYAKWANNHLWIGDTKNKGLGIFAKDTIDLSPLTWSHSYKDHDVKHFLPCRINNEFNLLAVWTHHNNSPTFGYIGQFWKYLQINKSNLQNCLILGDFNSNICWDKWDRWWNHSDVVSELSEIGIESLYHFFYKESQGKELYPTFFLQRNLEKKYHIDYVFGPSKFQDNLKLIQIGEVSIWLKISDHLPIFSHFKL